MSWRNQSYEAPEVERTSKFTTLLIFHVLNTAICNNWHEEHTERTVNRDELLTSLFYFLENLIRAHSAAFPYTFGKGLGSQH